MLPCPQLSTISIHALLAESDPTTVQNIELGYISIHALLAESDWRMPLSYAACQSFLSTLSLRRATYRVPHYKATPAISIHALLAESDATV